MFALIGLTDSAYSLYANECLQEGSTHRRVLKEWKYTELKLFVDNLFYASCSMRNLNKDIIIIIIVFLVDSVSSA